MSPHRPITGRNISLTQTPPIFRNELHMATSRPIIHIRRNMNDGSIKIGDIESIQYQSILVFGAVEDRFHMTAILCRKLRSHCCPNFSSHFSKVYQLLEPSRTSQIHSDYLADLFREFERGGEGSKVQNLDAIFVTRRLCVIDSFRIAAI